MENNKPTSRLSGDIKIGNANKPLDFTQSIEYYEMVSQRLEAFMIEYDIDKIDVGWSRNALIDEFNQNNSRQ